MIGSVSAAEFLVTLGASLGFLGAILAGHVEIGMALALMAGGVMAAPIAARLVRLLPPRLLGVLVGGMILLTNVRTGANAIGLGGIGRTIAYVVVVVVTGAAVVRVRRALAPAAEAAEETVTA